MEALNISDLVFECLLKHFGEFVSGEQLAEQLGISRNTIWKAVRALRSNGCEIQASTNKGYALTSVKEALSSHYLRFKTAEIGSINYRFQVFDSVSSTNTLLKELAEQGAPEGTVIIAEAQTAGRGRLGRRFSSPAGGGLYMSVLLRPSDKGSPLPATEALKITTASAVSVARSIEALCDIKAGIKWVNDIYVNGKKVCGILTEGALDLEYAGLEYAILGIGINVCEPKDGFEAEISHLAGALYRYGDPDFTDGARARLAADILERFAALYSEYVCTRRDCREAFINEYAARSVLTGKPIEILIGDRITEATALSVNDDCSLSVRYSDGSEARLTYGEVRIRLK